MDVFGQPDVEFYKTSDCVGTVLTRSLDPLNVVKFYDADDLGSYSGEVQAVRVKANYFV